MDMLSELMVLVNACGADAAINSYDQGKSYHITIDDYDGFDDDYEALEREYDNPQAVEALLEWLSAHCNKTIENLYTDYYFDNFMVEVGYTSFDI